jgi:branched-chain amino acid transport system permease protein
MFNGTLLISVLSTGMIYLLSAYGLIVTYRVAGVFNLAFGFLAAFCAFLYWQLVVGWGLDRYLSALIVVLVFAPLVGIATQQVLFRKRREVLSAIIITLGLGVALQGLIGVFWGSNNGTVLTAPSVFGGKYWRIGSAAITANEVGVIGCVIVIGAIVWILINRSRLGLQMRAVVDDPDLSGASGIPYSRISAMAWIVGSMLAALSGILLAPELNLDVDLLTGLVINAFAVAAFAGMSSLPLAALGALILAYAQALVERYPNVLSFIGAGASDVLPFVMLAVVLLVHPAAQRTVRVVGGGMQRRLRERASGNFSVALALGIALTVIAELLNPSWAFAGEVSACYALTAMSLVLLVGASGQISLCQVSFMGLAAILLGKLSGVPWGVGVVMAVLASAVAGLLVSLTAWRLRGLFLALITYAFAYALNVLLFQNAKVISFAGLSVNRPHFFGINFTNDRNFLPFVAAIVLIAIAIVGAVLKGPWGRALQTLSAGDNVASVSGLPVRLWKTVAFTVSAGLAGLAGCLLASVQITVTGDSFIPEASVFILVYAVVGGITTPTGAVIAGFIAGASGQVLQLFIGNAGSWQLVLFGVMAVQMTIMYPAGYGGMLPRELPGLRWLSARWHARGRAGPNEAVLPTAGGTS